MDFASIYDVTLRCSIWTVSRDPILRVNQFLLSVQMLVIGGKSWGSDLEGSAKFLFPRKLIVIIGYS